MWISIIFFMFLGSAEPTVDHCKQYEGNVFMSELLTSLSAKLSYQHAEFCTNSRIADIYHERKWVYHKEDDNYHPYEFVTIHYYEYSCEYQYNIEASKWADQYCYSTF